MKYEVVKGLTGHSVKFACPVCQSGLKSPLSDAGKPDHCPDCQASFVVPGLQEWESHQRQVQEKRDEAERIKIERTLAKSQEKLKRERRLAAEAEQKRQAEILAQEATEFSKRQKIELEKQRKRALAGLTFDENSHDWSTGAPYAYNCIQIGTMSDNWQADLNAIINGQAAKGWEYCRSENLIINRPQGCLGALLGMAPERFQVVVLIFRRPMKVRETEMRIGQQLGL